VLEQIADRVLLLAVRMLDAANRGRDTGDGVSVGGHQAGCASLAPASPAGYVDEHFGAREHIRFVALLGDAELDEGNIWEAVTDPARPGSCCGSSTATGSPLTGSCPSHVTGNASSCSPPPGGTCARSATAGGLQEKIAQPSGEAPSTWLDTVPDDKYWALLGQGGGALPSPIRERAPAAVAQVLADVPLAALGMDFRILKTPVRRRG
jgi:pyruvate dehydrogenase E1 component